MKKNLTLRPAVETGLNRSQPVFVGLQVFQLAMDRRPDRGCGLDRSWYFPVLIGYGPVQSRSFASLVTGLPNTTDWPLVELLKDKVAPLRRVIDRFIEPVMLKALAEKTSEKNSKEGEDLTLLAHLVRHTQGACVLVYLGLWANLSIR
jgi:hypothetical protein